MKFEELYNESIGLWPEIIDISDGEITGNGVLFNKLSIVWNEIEGVSKLKGEWYDLMAWIIFRSLHDIAKCQLQASRIIIEKAEVSREKIKHDLIETLQKDDYRDMLDDFVRTNPVS